MRKSVIAGLALWAAFAVFAGKAQPHVNYPCCLMGDTRGYECVFSSREQGNRVANRSPLAGRWRGRLVGAK